MLGGFFIPDIGIPVKIVDMARDLVRRSGFKPNVDIEIKSTGLRPGEKLYEELITEGEGIVKSPHEKLFVLRASSTIDPGWLGQKKKNSPTWSRVRGTGSWDVAAKLR